MQMLKILEIDTYKQYVKGSSVIQTGKIRHRYNGMIPWSMSWVGLIELQYCMWQMERYANTIDVTKPWDHPRAREWDSMTVQTYLESMWTETAKNMILLLCLTVNSCEPNELSFFSLLISIKEIGGIEMMIETEGGAQDRKIKGGAQLVCTKLANKLKSHENCRIMLESPVMSISNTHDDEGIFTITTRSGENYQCHFIIMAIPPTLASRIHYTPILPSWRDQFTQRFPMGYCIKTVTYFKRAWWRETGHSGFSASLHNSEHPLTNCIDGTINNSLVGFMLANNARQWSSKTEQERKEAILKQYAEMFEQHLSFVQDQVILYKEMVSVLYVVIYAV
jgi:monoamine oxidase